MDKKLLDKNENKYFWTELINEEDVAEYFKNIILNFFIEDDISIEMYNENQKANEIVQSMGNLETFEMARDLSAQESNITLNPSPSFRKHFSTFDRPLLPDWFIIGYPDVAKYVGDNSKMFDKFVEQRKDEYFDENNKPNNELFRYLIDFYKQKVNKLELAI
jgi:hypothetical protein